MIDLKIILKLHAMYLNNEPGGVRADLSGADLSGADLSCADLSCAYLSCVDLSGADLSCAYLRGADLSGADLSYAYLSYANLRGADLSYANLTGADLPGANLSSANLSYANLSYADLSGANLSKTIHAGKSMYSFQFEKHYAYYFGINEIVIGCHRRTIAEWVKTYKSIGKFQGYTPKQIKAYGEFIKQCAKLYKARR